MATFHVKTTSAGSNDGSDWDNCFDLASFKTWFENNANAGDTAYIMSGTYTLSDHLNTTRGGSASGFVTLVGVSDESYTEAQGTDRPLFECGSWYFGTYANPAYHIYRNIRLHTESSVGMRIGTATAAGYGGMRNCYVKQESANDARICYTLGADSWIYDCEAEGGGDSIGIDMQNHRCLAMGCYLHDLNIGFRGNGKYGQRAIFCVVEDCVWGIYCTNGGSQFVMNCTIDGNTSYGIYNSAVAGSLYLNNIISNNGTGIYVTSMVADADYNHYYNNTTDVSGITKGDNATSGDPDYTDDTNDDFSLANTSPCIDAALGIRLAGGS